jgi:molecular chaperone DnaJ
MTHYDTLEINENSSKKEIKSSYKRLAKIYHPDKDTGDEETFKEINVAYTILSDEEKRKQYDNQLNVEKYHDYQEQMFRERIQRNNKPKEWKPSTEKDVKINLRTDVKAIQEGFEGEVEYVLRVICKDCNGEGGEGKKDCADCNGSGVVVNSNGPFFQASMCRKCDGKGKTFDNPCDTCYTTGVTMEKHTIKFDVKERK